MTREKTDDVSCVMVRLFASVREAVGRDEIMVPMASHQTTAGDLKKSILDACPILSSKRIVFVLAVNHKVAASNSAISHDDEVAVLPAVSGG
jgi:molybdopterin converting factor small subunit